MLKVTVAVEPGGPEHTMVTATNPAPPPQVAPPEVVTGALASDGARSTACGTLVADAGTAGIGRFDWLRPAQLANATASTTTSDAALNTRFIWILP